VAYERLDLLLVLAVDLILVLGPEEHCGVVERRVAEAATRALDHGGCQNLNNI